MSFKIIVKARPQQRDYYGILEGSEAMVTSGPTEDAVVGDLVRMYAKKVGITILFGKVGVETLVPDPKAL